MARTRQRMRVRHGFAPQVEHYMWLRPRSETFAM